VARVVLIAALLLAACDTTAPPEATPTPNVAPTLSFSIAPTEADLDVAFQVQVDVADDAGADGLMVRFRGGPGDAQDDLGGVLVDAGQAALTITADELGAFTVIAAVTDLDGATTEATATVTIVDPVNGEPPTVAIVAPTDGALLPAGTPITFGGIATDDGGSQFLTVSWTTGDGNVLSTAPPAEDGSIAAFTHSLPLGSHSVTLTADDGLNPPVSDTVAFEVVAPNDPPSAPQVAIEPAAPLTDDALTCTVTVPGVDPEGEPVTHELEWLKDGAPTGITSATVAATSTTRGEQWRCQAVATDGVSDSELAFAVASIGNSVPSITGATLTANATPATVESTFTCTPDGWSDADGDAENYTYDWYVDGTFEFNEHDPTFTPTDAAPLQVVTCTVIPDDGTDAGPMVTSNGIALANAPPSAPGVSVAPAMPTPADDVTCSITTDAVDPEGAPIAGYTVSWLLDGVPDGSLDGLWVLPSPALELGDDWTCSVTASDGIADGPAGQAVAQVRPALGDVVISEFLAEPVAVLPAAGQWVEVYNAASYTVNLAGFELADDAGAHTFATSVLIDPGSYAVLGLNGDVGSNGGVDVDVEYSGLDLDAVDTITLSFDGLLVDEVAYDLSTFSAYVGHAVAFDAALGTPQELANDDAGAWCASMLPIVDFDSDFGTPGAANGTCACYGTDGDGDGFGVGVDCPADDCDDAEPLSSPAGVEICDNGIDDDCLDGELTCACEASDDDGDGFGDDPSCVRLDCDDAAFTINPDALESCDGVDEDCDGTADEGYANFDGDGLADCVDPDADGDGDPFATDCDDFDPARASTFVEVCNAIDDDCDGAVNEDSGDPSEANETLATADDRGLVNGTLAVPVTESIPGRNLHHAGDVDWYSFQVDDWFFNNAWVSFSVTGLPTTGSYVAELWKSEDGGNTWSLRQSRTGNTSLSAAEPRDTWLGNESEDDWAVAIYALPGSWEPAACSTYYTLAITESG
jgi:hypothetical protein